MHRSKILGTGSYLPDRVVKNADLERWMDTTDQWIQQRTGIKERRFVEEGVGTSDLAWKASRHALEAAHLTPQDLDFIVFATLTPDYNFPGSGCLLQDKLGVGTIGALDVRNQCSGFLYALAVADQFIRTGTYRHILVVGAEVHSTGLDLSTRGRDLAVIFGDGAGAVVLGPAGKEEGCLLASHLHSEGKHAKRLWLEAPASVLHPRLTVQMIEEGRHYPRMDGRAVFKHAVERFQHVINETLDAEHLAVKDVGLFILHQANLRIAEAVATAMRIPADRMFNNIERYGNTTAASIPIALDEAVRQGRLRPGDLVLLAAFGSGFTWAATLLRW
ncbi:MAG: beta-ketoacyl-ACP synthase III [Acidobacteriota bacterium]